MEEAVNPELSELSAAIESVKKEIAKCLVGQEKMVELILTALMANGHILIEGVPGIAKTLTAKLVARSVDAKFSRIQFTPDLMPSDIIGTSIFMPNKGEFQFKRGPIFTNIALVDEINRSPAKTQAALFEVMEERQITVDGKSHQLEAPFLVIATQNPVEHEGTYRLPEAQLDRFLLRIKVSYPSESEELQILEKSNSATPATTENVQIAISSEKLQQLQRHAQQIVVDQDLLKYIVSIAQKSRQSAGIYLGASPRASVALMQAAKAFAAIQGRDFITPDDIKYVAEPVLAHRIILSAEKELEGVTQEEMIRQIVNSIEVPR